MGDHMHLGMFTNLRLEPAPNCIKDSLDLPDESGQSGLTLQLFPVVILVNQVCRYNCFQRKQLNVKPDWPELPDKPMNFSIHTCT